MIRDMINGIKAGYHLARGIARVQRMNTPRVTIFGGSRVDEKELLYQQAYNLAYQLLSHNISILTGGGPGVMQAINHGAYEAKKDSSQALWNVGIGVRGVDEEFKRLNMDFFNVEYFYMRKQLLIHYSHAIIIFPGGIGTMDELFEALNMFKHDCSKWVPVILFDSDYWQPIIAWYQDAVQKGYIRFVCKDFFVVQDSIDDIITTVIHRFKNSRLLE